MTPERWEAIKRIFASVVDLPPGDRGPAVGRACASDPTLRAEVEELLEAHARAPAAFLADPPLARGAEDDPFAALPERFGPCRIERRLGSGGMGTVFLANMVEERPWAAAGTRVAVKVLHPDLLIDPGARQRFTREQTLGGRVEHPAVVRVHALEVVRAGAASYHGLIQEYVPGQTLRELMQELGPVPEPLLRQVALEVAAGLEAIHQAGAVHRDLKPENLIFTSDQRVKILDLGAVHLVDGDGPSVTASRAFVGSSRYAAPEQFEGGALGPAADLYALGVVLYEAATGTNPFAAAGIHAVMRLHLEKVPARAGTLRPDLTPFLEELLSRLLAKKPQDRLASSGELVRLLEEGESSRWWRSREQELRTERTLRRTRVTRETPFVAREEEVATLLGAWSEARKGQGSLVLIEGEAGIGKSRLVEEVLERAAADAEPWLLLESRFEHASAGLGALGRSLASHLGDASLEERLAPLLTATPGLVGAFAALLRGDQAPAGAVPLTPESTQTLFCHVARALATQRPVLWLLEDLHLASPDARAIVLSLARIVEDARLLLVATAREGLPAEEVAALEQARGARRMPLDRLSAREVVDLVCDSLGSTWLGEELGGRIAHRSDGNPFFVVEMLRELRRTGLVDKLHEGTTTSEKALAAIDVPSSVRGLLDLRLGSLVEEDRVLLDAASVAGFEFDPDLVARVLGRERLAVLQSLARLERRTRLVRSRGSGFSFDHHLLVETLLVALPPSLLREYHGRLAAAIAGRDGLDAASPGDVPGDAAVRIVGHLLRGPRPTEAEPLLGKAIGHLRRSNAYGAILETVDVALSAIPSLDASRRCDLRLLQAEVAGPLGLSGEEMVAVEAATAAANEAGQEARLAACHLARAAAFRNRDEFAPAAIEAGAARRLAELIGDRKTEVMATNLLGQMLARLDRLPEACSELERAVALAADGQDRDDECSALAELGFARQMLGDAEAAKELIRASLRMAEGLGLTIAATAARRNLSLVLMLAGQLPEAQRCLEAIIREYRERGTRRLEASSLGNLGLLKAEIGELPEAMRLCEQTRRLGRETAAPWMVLQAEASLGYISFARGEVRAAREYLRSAVSLARQISTQCAEKLCSLSQVCLEEGDVDEAEKLIGEARDRVGQGSDVTDVHALAEASIALTRCRGEPERALQMLADEISLRRAHGMTKELAQQIVRAGSLLLDLGRRDEALPHLLEAERVARETSDWHVGVLPEAYLALAGARNPHAVVVSENAPVHRRAEAHLVLHRAGAGGDHLARARELCEHLSRHLSGDALGRFWCYNTVARGVLQEERRAGAPA